MTLLCAVFSSAWAADVTDVLTRDATGVTGSTYASWSDVKLTSNAVYAGQSAGGNESIQLRSNNNNSGIITTASGGTVKSITVTWNSNTAAGRTLNIYGSNTAYSDPTELYNADTQGTLLGTIVNGESTTLNVEGDYTFIGMRSNSAAMYLEAIEITWSSASAPALAAPTFSPKAGTYYEPQSVTISCATEGASIYYTTNGAEPTTSSTKYTAPINVSATTTIKAISVKGSEKSAVASATYTIEELTSLANIAALSAQTEGGAYGVSFNNVVVTYVNGNYAYMQDASGAIVLYKSGHGLTAGQVLNGKAEVTFQLRNGNPQITALAGVSASDGTAPEPKTVAASAWSTPISSVLSQYFKVTGATITKDGTKYYVQLGSENVQLYGQGDARTISVSDLSTTYTIIGFPTVYNTTPELQIFVQPEAEGAVKPEAGLSYGEGVSTVTVTIGEAYTLPTLSNPNNVPVTYSSSNTEVATVDATGKVNVLAKGQTTIKAEFAGNSSFLAGEVSYTLVVKEARVLPEGTFFYETFDGLTGTGGRDGEFSGTVGNGGFNNADGTNPTDETWTSTENSGAAAQCAKLGTSSKASVFTTGAIKITGEGSLTFEAAGWGSGNNTLTVTATGATLDGDTEITLVNSEWNKYTVSISGAQGEVVITFAGKRGFIDEIKVTNEKATVLKDPELSYGEPAKYDAVLGEPFTAPTLNNPYGVTVTYSSSNEKVATVDASTGAITLAGAGETTITASSEKTNTYKAGSASYTLSVTVPEIPIEDNGDRFALVEDYSTLKAGDQIVLVGVLTVEADEENGTEASTTYYGMGIKQNNNNREAVKVTYNTDKSISGNTALQTITLEGATGEWLFNVGNGYLYAASSKSNYLRTEEEADDNAKASISAEEGIVFKGENTRNQLRFNDFNILFSCYASTSTTGSLAKIYRKVEQTGMTGDANGDGEVNITDVIVIVNYVLNRAPSEFVWKNADVNKDGEVNITDALIIVKDFVLKKEG